MGINRGTVLDLINDVHRVGGFKDYNSYSYLFDQVDTMPESKENTEPHWIPVTERLPKEDGTYLVSGKWGSGKESVGDCEFSMEDGYFQTAWNFDVLAWMPLPEPYKGVTE